VLQVVETSPHRDPRVANPLAKHTALPLGTSRNHILHSTDHKVVLDNSGHVRLTVSRWEFRLLLQ